MQKGNQWHSFPNIPEETADIFALQGSAFQNCSIAKYFKHL
jgi:hypothetical protein